MKRVLVLGATGRTGRLVLQELAENPSIELAAALRKESDQARLPKLDRKIETFLLDFEQPMSLETALLNVDVVVQAVRLREDVAETAWIDMDQKIRQASDNPALKIVTVGGAGTLRLADGKRFWQSASFPKQTLPRAIAHDRLRSYLENLNPNNTWAYLIPPPAYIADGVKKGSYQQYQAGSEEELFLEKSISYADFAAALADAVAEDWTGVHLIADEYRKVSLA